MSSKNKRKESQITDTKKESGKRAKEREKA